MKSDAVDSTRTRWSARELVAYFGGLAEAHPREVLYCPNPGNAGDSLIAQGTYTAFRRAGLRYRSMAWDEPVDSTGRVVMYGGGGNLTIDYSYARSFVSRHHKRAARLVVLPHTINGHADVLADLGSNVDLFCRERRSYNWVQEKAPGANVYLADDLALHADVEALRGDVRGAMPLAGEIAWTVMRATAKRTFGRAPGQGEVIPLRAALRHGRAAVRNMIARPTGDTLFALREDVEAAGGALPPHNVDLSQIFAYGTTPGAVAYRATRALLSYIDRFDHVVTNRLHVGIPAAMLGKRVDFYANSYYKNKAIYAFSLRDQYPNVTWRGTWLGADSL